MPDVLVPLLLAKASAASTAFVGADAAAQNVLGGSLQPCQHEGGDTGYLRNNMCHAPGDPNHHEVCAEITKDFWQESGQGEGGIFGKWCICVHKLGDWLRGTHDHTGITGIDCGATSAEALHGDAEAAKYISEHCPKSAVVSAMPVLALLPDTRKVSDASPPTGFLDFI
eukprot:TRINITY_DN28695_c0_g1_i1.p1 TRINITY_DN28695_c0_g1~~TRINITY_DN28695_c0_g1_i1.p1  ORF type:complete len:185 (-),score=21.75 TRINITY_DN28695_c0_g1_i1:204-710(-)